MKRRFVFCLGAMLLITEKLGFTIDDIYECYQKKNKVNFERLKNGY